MKNLLFLIFILILPRAQSQDSAVSHYLFPEFTDGTIIMNLGQKYDALLNYNILTEEMIFESEGNKLAIAKNELSMVDTIIINERKFIPLDQVFIELIRKSDWELYTEYKCDLRETGKDIGYGAKSRTTSISNYSSFYSAGQLYDLKLPDIFEIRPYMQYWLKKNGKYQVFRNKRDLRKIYKKKKDSLNEYLKDNDIKFNKKDDIIKVIEYLESTAS